MRHSFQIAAYGLAAALLLAPVANAQTTQVPAQARAGAYTLNSDHSKITWSVNHLGFSTYVGQFHGVTGTLRIDPASLATTELQVTIDTNLVATLTPALDTHLKSADFLDTARFPTATFKSTKVVRTGDRTADVTGDLTLNGQTHPATLEATFEGSGRDILRGGNMVLGFSARGAIDRTQWGVNDWRAFTGSEVQIVIEAEFVRS